jgi:hypothetical protein
LTAEDLTVEQSYFLQKGLRHNRYLHGYGVAWGLVVNVSKGDTELVKIEPGFALDCFGNEIEITDAFEAAVDLAVRQKECFVVVRYEEFAFDEVPSLASVGQAASSKAELEQRRIKEGYKIYFEANNPLLSHKCKPGQKTCGKPHPIPIARLRRARKGWALDHEFVVPRCN